MREMTDVKSKKIGAMLRLIAFIAAVVMVAGFSLPMFRKSSALGAVGRRAVAEMTPFSAAVAYYSGGEIARLSQKPKEDDASYRSIAGLLSQINIQQGYEQLYLVYRDQNKSLRYLESGGEFPLSAYKPLKGMIDRIYTGKSIGEYATDLVVREDGKSVAISCLPIYGGGRTVLAVLVAEADPGNIGYHLVGPVNLYYLGGGAAAVLALCLLLLYLGRKLRLSRQQRDADAAKAREAAAVPSEETILPEDDFQLPCDPVEPPIEQPMEQPVASDDKTDSSQPL